MPVSAVIFPVIICALLAILNIPSTIALLVFTSLSTFALYVSYISLIGCMIDARLRRPHQLSFGTWKMGEWGLSVNVFALLYSLYVAIWLVCPTSQPITAANMNYALPLWAGFVCVALGLWIVWGRRSWKGINEDIVGLVLKD